MRPYTLTFLALVCLASHAQDLETYSKSYFAGSTIKFGYGSGTSSNNELVVHYCSSGLYYSEGQSCRPNIIARGYQCTNIQDAGQWAIQVQNGQASIHWMSQASGPGWLPVYRRDDGVFVDHRNNPLTRLGSAVCN